MFAIRKAQMQAFSAALREDFEDRMARRLKAVFPQEVGALAGEASGDEKCRVLIRREARKAAAYGIEERRDLAAFIELAVALGPDFEGRQEFSWARKVFLSETVPTRAKMRVIFDQLPQRHPEFASLRFPKENTI